MCILLSKEDTEGDEYNKKKLQCKKYLILELFILPLRRLLMGSPHGAQRSLTNAFVRVASFFSIPVQFSDSLVTHSCCCFVSFVSCCGGGCVRKLLISEQISGQHARSFSASVGSY